MQAPRVLNLSYPGTFHPGEGRGQHRTGRDWTPAFAAVDRILRTML